MTGSKIQSILGGVLHAGHDQQCSGVSTDTRSLAQGDLFVALKGDNFDGHDFIEAAVEKGCCGCIVSRGDAVIPSGGVHLHVSDTLAALGSLASAHLKSTGVPVIAVTGSNGKTGTKELISCALGAYGNVARNPGNHNNLIGLPLAALQVESRHDYAVLEMGMNQPGEIERLTEIASPKIGLVTSIAQAHLEGLGDIEDVARAKGELYRTLDSNAIAIVNARDPWVVSASVGTRAKVITVGNKNADVVCESVRRHGVAGLSAVVRVGSQRYDLNLRALGRHSVWNAVLALAVVYALELDPTPALAELETHNGVPGRLQWRVASNGVNVIDDTYNANPASMRAALETLAELGAGRNTYAVLGDMLELGSQSSQLHHEIGAYASDLDVNKLFVAGMFAGDVVDGFGAPGAATSGMDCADFIAPLKSQLGSGDWVLVKGSRGARMERVVEAILSNGEVN